MSRGPGKTQAVILAYLEKVGAKGATADEIGAACWGPLTGAYSWRARYGDTMKRQAVVKALQRLVRSWRVIRWGAGKVGSPLVYVAVKPPMIPLAAKRPNGFIRH